MDEARVQAIRATLCGPTDMTGVIRQATLVPELLNALERSQAEVAMFRGALAWVRDGLDQMYSVTNDHGQRSLPPELEPHAGLIASLHKTVLIALGESHDGGPQ